MPRIHIRKDTKYFFPVLYVLKTIEQNHGVEFDFIDSPLEADLIWDHLHEKTQVIATDFYDLLAKDYSLLSHKKVFADDPQVKDKNGRQDVIAGIFYMINAIQEYAAKPEELDRFGRFSYESSYQNRFNCIEEDLVQQQISSFCLQHGIIKKDKPSVFFISHDIDTIYGSLLQDSFWAIKKLKPMAMLQIIAAEISRRPHWRNMDRIININSEYDIKSTFFWLVNQGKGKNNIENADYKFKKEQSLLKLVEKKGFINGLHKSTLNTSINEELATSEYIKPYNRYHFLDFLPPTHWKEISDSSLEFDSSLGFAERYGFRNSYGSAFQPFDLRNNIPYNFIEAPLTFMDATLHKYMKIEKGKIAKTITGFYEKHPVNCHLSLLWHNTYFTNYKFRGFISEYRKILEFIFENKIKCLTPAEIINQTKLQW